MRDEWRFVFAGARWFTRSSAHTDALKQVLASTPLALSAAPHESFIKRRRGPRKSGGAEGQNAPWSKMVSLAPYRKGALRDLAPWIPFTATGIALILP